MKKYLISFVITGMIINVCFCQTNTDLIDFNKSRNRKTNNALKVLGGWAVANECASGYYYYHSTGSDKYFNQMNVIWNGVNLLIVGTSIFNHPNNDLSLTNSLKAQHSIETIYISNTILDLVYSSLGLYLTEKAKNDLANRDKYNGWGVEERS